MDKSAAIAIVEREVDALVEGLGIPHWRLKILYGPIDGYGPPTGQCTRLVDYDQATIELDPERIDDEAHLLKILRHELFHVLLSPYDLYMATVEAPLDDDSPEAKRLDRVWRHAMEQAVINLERMWQGSESYWRARIMAKVQKSKGKSSKMPASMAPKKAKGQGGKGAKVKRGSC